MRVEPAPALEERLRAGQRQALSEALAIHRERLWRMVNFRMDARLRGRVDPDDVLQEAFLAAEQRLEHFRDEASHSVFIWLRLIVAQTLVDVHRRHLEAEMRDVRREVSINNAPLMHSTSVSLADRLVGSLTSPSQAAQQRELSRQLMAALERMEPIDQEIIALRHFEDLSNIEVAEALNLKPSAASNRYIRALGRFRDVLDQLPGFAPNDPGGVGG